MTDSIMIGTMIRNSGLWLPRYWEMIKKLDYPPDKIRIVFIYGISTDYTLKIAKKIFKEKHCKVEIYKEQFNLPMKQGGAQLAELAYKDWQELLEEDYFLLMDSDVIKTPSNLIKDLQKVDADIVAPYPWSEKHRHFYDSWIFRINNVRFDPKDPPGKGLSYPIEVDSVGTCFLATNEVFKEIEITNPYPNLTLCLDAKKRGFRVAACPYIEVFHVDVEKLGIVHHPLPPKFGGYPQQGFVDSNYHATKIFLKDELKAIDEGLDSDE